MSTFDSTAYLRPLQINVVYSLFVLCSTEAKRNDIDDFMKSFQQVFKQMIPDKSKKPNKNKKQIKRSTDKLN